MEVFEGIYENLSNKNCILALGNFDGVHSGHQHLLNNAREYAKANVLLFGVYTFIDSPKFLDAHHSVLSTLQSRLSNLNCFAQPDFVYLEKFSDVCDYSPYEFVKYIIEKFSCTCTFCGENFSFGKYAAGKSRDLCLLMKQFGGNCVIVESLREGDEIVSSTLIKSLLTAGNVERAEKLLCQPYGFVEKVVHGAHLGHKLGFPTINQIVPKTLMYPAYGVYSTVVIIDGKEYMGVTNFGVKPTVSSDNTPVAETYVLDFDGDVYNKYVGLYFCKRLRDEKKFSSIDELKENIAKNVIDTRRYFEEKYENA